MGTPHKHPQKAAQRLCVCAPHPGNDRFWPAPRKSLAFVGFFGGGSGFKVWGIGLVFEFLRGWVGRI